MDVGDGGFFWLLAALCGGAALGSFIHLRRADYVTFFRPRHDDAVAIARVLRPAALIVFAEPDDT